MHFCTAHIQIAGDSQQVMFRSKFNPVSWPEIELLRSIHGDEAVLEVKPFVRVEQSAKAERERLVLKYGAEALNVCFPGRNPSMSMDAAEADIAYGETWKNPLTQLPETIEEAPAADTSKPKNNKKAESVL